ncbi:MAG: hypothetical protein ACHQK8_03700 [Bacteroidia bacterium]
MKKLFSILIIFVLSMGVSHAQDSTQKQVQNLQDEISNLKKPSKTHFMIRGFAQFGFNASDNDVNFNMTSFNPVLLWRQGDRFLFETELEMEYMTNQLSLNLGYASASYMITKGLVVKFGKILVPFGTFGEKLHPSWVNKCVTMPLGIGHDGAVPMSDIGFEIKGGLQFGSSKISYAAYAVNGPTIKDGTGEPTEAGMLAFDNAIDNNKNKALGARIAFLPFSNSSLEIGLSAYYGMPGSATAPFAADTNKTTAVRNLTYNNVTALLTAIDLSYVKLISEIGGIIDIKGQYTMSDVSKASYINPTDSISIRSPYTFTNSSVAYYGQIAYRPALAENQILKNLELVGRYSVYNTPSGSNWYSNKSQITIGLNYWLTWRTVIKADYEMTTVDNGMSGSSGSSGMTGMAGMSGMGNTAVTSNVFMLHLAMGF